MLVLLAILLFFANPNLLFAQENLLLPIKVEVSIIQVNKKLVEKFNLQKPEADQKIKVSVADLIYALADQTSANLMANTQLITYNAQTRKIDIRREVEYMEQQPGGSMVKKNTGKAVGAVMEATPVIDEDGKIIVDLDFQFTTALPAEKVDPNTSIRIGRPYLTPNSIKTRVKVNPGSSSIIGQMNKKEGNEYVLLKAEILREGNYSLTNNSDEKGILDQTLDLWNKKQNNLALDKFFKIDWQKKNIISNDSVLKISESQYNTLGKRERAEVHRKAIKLSKDMRKIAYHARNRAIKTFAAEDFRRAETKFNSIYECGRFLAKPDSLPTLRIAGKAIMKNALSDLINIYSQTEQEGKLEETRDKLKEIK